MIAFLKKYWWVALIPILYVGVKLLPDKTVSPPPPPPVFQEVKPEPKTVEPEKGWYDPRGWW